MVDAFIKFEDENHLFDRHIGDFYYWHYIRYEIYKRVFWREALISQAGDKPKLKDLMTMLYCALFRNTWFVHKHVDILALGYPRKIKNADGTREDPYIEPIVKNTRYSSLTLEVYSRQSDNIDSEHRYVRFIQDTMLHSKLAERFLLSSEKEKLREEAENIAGLFAGLYDSVNVGTFYNVLKNVYSIRKVFKRKFKKLLKRTTPYCIIATPGYTERAMALNELALEYGIPTVEIEHGFFTEDAVPQNFYKKQMIRSYPQYFFANSQYKPDNVRFPIDKDHVKVVGSPYLEKRVKNRKSKMIKGEIVLLDDNKYSNILLDFADKLLKYLSDNKLSDYHVTLKAHPANKCDSPTWERLKERSDVTCIIGIKGKSVYDCLERAEVVVGICSSTLFEAQAYGCRVCAIKCEGSKMMRRFAEQGYGAYVSEPSDIFSKSNQKRQKELWRPDALQCTLREIEKLIERVKEK